MYAEHERNSDGKSLSAGSDSKFCLKSGKNARILDFEASEKIDFYSEMFYFE